MKQSLSAESEQQRRPSNHATSDISHANGQKSFVDNRPQAAAQRQLIETINASPKMIAQSRIVDSFHNSPQMVAQRKLHNQMRSQTLQLQAEPEEAPLQGKSDPVQRQSEPEEELLQGKFDSIQRQGLEDEELLQGKFAAVQRVEEEELLQGKLDTVQRLEEEELLQGQFVMEPTAQPAPQKNTLKHNNTGLPDNLKTGIENLSGMSMDNVKVHYNSSQPAQLNAHAYAQGTDIHVAPGQEQHLPHEAWHVVQQAQGRVKPTMQMKGGIAVNDDRELETEADLMGAKAWHMVVSSDKFATNSKSYQRIKKAASPFCVRVAQRLATLQKTANANLPTTLRQRPLHATRNFPVQAKWVKFVDLSHKEYNIAHWVNTDKELLINDHRKDGWYRTDDSHNSYGTQRIPDYQVEELLRSNDESGTRFGYSDTLLEYILSFLESTDLLSLRLMSKQLNSKAMIEAKRRVPYPDFTIFALLNQVMFPDVFAKGNFTDEPMNKKGNLEFAWLQYQQTLEGRKNLALVGRIFQTSTFLKLQNNKEKVESLQKNQVVFRPATKNKWSPQIDDSWILGHIHKKSVILLMFDPSDQTNIYDDKSKRITATGREILIALNNGYEPLANKESIEGVSGGVLMAPPDWIKNTQGVQKSDLGVINIQNTFGKLLATKKDPQKVNDESFGKKVESNVEENINEQIKGALKNFKKLQNKFNAWYNKLNKELKLSSKSFKSEIESKGTEFAVVDPLRIAFFKAKPQIINTCISLLTPDTYIVPSDQQDEFRTNFFQCLDKDNYPSLGKNPGKFKSAVFKRIYNQVLLEVLSKK